MTKLVEWLVVVGTIAAVWASVAFGYIEGIPKKYQEAALPVPIYLILVFGVYSVIVILYRVMTFNDCVKAAEELKAEIKEARKDLISKGLKIDSKKES